MLQLAGLYIARAAAFERALGAGWRRVMSDSIAAHGANLVRADTEPVIGFRADGYLE